MNSLSTLKDFDIDFHGIRSSAVKFLSVGFPTHVLVKRDRARKIYSCYFKCGLLKRSKISTFTHLSCLLCHLVFPFFFFLSSDQLSSFEFCFLHRKQGSSGLSSYSDALIFNKH